MVPRKEEASGNLQGQQTHEVQRESVGGGGETGQKWMIRLVKHSRGKSEQQGKKEATRVVHEHAVSGLCQDRFGQEEWMKVGRHKELEARTF